MKKPEENEVKIAASSAAKVRALLRQHSFRVIKPRILEQNTVLDDEYAALKASGRLLRVRRAGKTVTCTFKGIEAGGPHKRREEREFHPDSFDDCLAFFNALGYAPVFYYEKYRTELARPEEPGHITIDETPIGIFLELEGPPRWLDRTAKELGYSPDDYITASYGALFAEWKKEHQLNTSEMRF